MNEQQRLFDLTAYEREAWEKGVILAGMDEAGRGPLAGPVVAACVVMPQQPLLSGVNDSKKIAENKREILFEQIRDVAIAYGIGLVDEHEIDEINILNATKKAMHQAYEGMQTECDLLLVDAVALSLPCETRSLIKGDAVSYCIAAASILAKVTRDRMMRALHEQYPQYGFAKHKGYGTKEHMAALRQYGACPHHRKTFIKRVFT